MTGLPLLELLLFIACEIWTINEDIKQKVEANRSMVLEKDATLALDSQKNY